MSLILNVTFLQDTAKYNHIGIILNGNSEQHNTKQLHFHCQAQSICSHNEIELVLVSAISWVPGPDHESTL